MNSSVFVALIVWIILIPFLYCFGSLFLGRFKEQNFLLRGILYVGLGFGLLSYSVILSGYFKMMKPIVFVALVSAILTLRRSKIFEFSNWFLSLFREVFHKSKGLLERMGQAIFLISLSITFLICFLPEISNDALAHHLALPKRYLQMGQVAPVPYDFKSYQSILMNALYVIGLMFNSVSAAKLFHWWTGVFLTFSLIIFINEHTNKRWISIFWGLLLWLTPTFMAQVSTTYVDIGVAFFLFLSFYLFWQGLETKKIAVFFLSGVFLGFAANSKYSGLLGGLPFVVFLAYSIFKSRFHLHYLKVLCSFGVGFCLFGGFLFIRNWMLTGNPLFPIFSSFVGVTVSSELTEALTHGLGPPKSVISFLLIPWNYTFNLKYVTLGEWLGPFYFLSLPFSVYGFFKNRLARFSCYFVFFYLVGWFFMGPHERYLLPVLPVSLISSAIGLNQFFSQKSRKRWVWSFSWFSAFIILFLFSLSLYRFRFQYPAVIGVWNYRTYLETMERTYPIAEWVNQNLPLNAKILVTSEPRLFYFDREVIREGMLHHYTHYADGKKPEEIVRFLKSIGVTHILMSDRLNHETSSESSERLAKLSTHLTRKLISVDSRNKWGYKFQYTIYELNS